MIDRKKSRMYSCFEKDCLQIPLHTRTELIPMIVDVYHWMKFQFQLQMSTRKNSIPNLVNIFLEFQ